MKTAEEILKDKEEIAQIQGIDFSVIIFNDALDAMNEYAEQYIEKIKYLEKVIKDMENGR
ncbi:MAG TPA: hypothetical protein PK206_12515 [Chitinophagales bacterium]|nr:hypothetical protein [Chitinophagales bacterium]